jgi:hypothetical protein
MESTMTDTGTGNKIGPTLVPKPQTECAVGELVRLDGGAWAIVASDPNVAKNHPKDKVIFVIYGDKAPRASLLSGDSNDLCLSYGTGFQVLPVNASFEGTHAYGREEIQLSGKLIYSRPFERDGRARRYFAATGFTGYLRFLDLDDFQVTGEPQGYRALFQDWEVSMSWPAQHDMVTLVKSSGK